MQVAMTPVRMVSQWMMLPIMLVLVGVAGTSIGLFDAWAAAQWIEGENWPTAIGTSTAIWILLPVIAGLVTNSWSIAATLGAFAMFAGQVAEPVGERIFHDDYVWISWSGLLTDIPLALLAGAILGWAGSAWRHDEGIVRAMAASVIAGALTWTAWDVLADTWSREGYANQIAWFTLGLAAIVVVLCRSIPEILLSIAGTTVVTAGLLFGLDVQNESWRAQEIVSELIDRLRDLVNGVP